MQIHLADLRQNGARRRAERIFLLTVSVVAADRHHGEIELRDGAHDFPAGVLRVLGQTDPHHSLLRRLDHVKVGKKQNIILVIPVGFGREET